VSSSWPSKPEWMYLALSQPATRLGYLTGPAYTAGFVTCFPMASETDQHGNVGSWLWPGAGNCNPYHLMACSKGAITHTTLQPQSDSSHRHSALLFVKITWCVEGACDGPNCPQRCYTFKRGQCLRFNKAVMPEYASAQTKAHSKAAFAELKAGRFSTDCSAMARRGAQGVLAGN